MCRACSPEDLNWHLLLHFSGLETLRAEPGCQLKHGHRHFALWLFVVVMEVVFDHGEHLQYRWPFAVALLMKHCVY